LGIGYWVLGIGYWVLGIGYWALGQYNIEKNKNGNIRLFWERLDAPHSFSTSEVPPKGPSVTDATFSPGPGNQNGHLASKRSRKRAIFS
jgi:hypothetical protein